MRTKERAIGVVAAFVAVGLGCQGTAIVSGRTVQGATFSTFAAEEITVMLSATTLQLVGNVSFTCPTVTPTTAGASSYNFDFGTGCMPSPGVLVTGTVSGSATVAVSGSTLTVSYQNLAYAGVTLNGSATVTTTGSGSARSYTVNGSYTARYDGKTYTVSFSNFAASGNLSGQSLTLTTSGAATVSDGVGTITLTASNVVFTSSSVTGTISLTVGGGYLAVTVNLTFEATAGGVRVTTSLAGIPVSFTYPL